MANVGNNYETVDNGKEESLLYQVYFQAGCSHASNKWANERYKFGNSTEAENESWH